MAGLSQYYGDLISLITNAMVENSNEKLNKKYYTMKIFLRFSQKIVETEVKSMPFNTHFDDLIHCWLDLFVFNATLDKISWRSDLLV